MKTFYDLLGVRPDADAKVLKTGFRKAIKASHPDLHPEDPRALSKFKQIVAANGILSDAVRRAAYDQLLKLERQRRRLEGRLFLATVAIVFTVTLVGAHWINYAPSDQWAELTEIAAADAGANTVGNNPYEGRNDGEPIVNVGAVSKPPLAPPGSVPAMQPQSLPRPVAPAATGAMDLSLRLAEQTQSVGVDIALIMERSAALIAHGDVTAARVMLQRAAEAGDPGAAFALGETYDPSVLGARGVKGGIMSDIAVANSWYERAKGLAQLAK